MAWKFCALVLCTEAAEVPLGCFLYGWKISDAIWGTPNPVNATDALHCQQICINTPHCETFGFQPAWKDCWLGSKMQVPARSSAVSFVSGPAKCAVAGQFGTGLSASPACALSPSSDFPGDTALQSASDFADDMVPVPLQCWPHLPNGELALCKGLPVETLEDTATGWPGKCLGLARTDLPMTEDCESSCRGNVSCASFQEVRTEGGLLQCWQGTGYDCFRDDGHRVNVVQAKRFMHGHYRVLKDLRGYEVTGLQYAFAGSFFSDVNEAVKMCNHTCLSNIGCHAWRFSTGDGCWFDDPLRGSLTYPPSSKDFISNTEAAALVVAGEYIQRLCEVPQDLTGSTTFTSTLLPQALQIAVPLPGVVTPNVSAALPTVALPSLTTLAPTLAPNASNHTAATAATAAASAAAAAAAAAGVAATPTMAPLPEPVTPAPVRPVTLPTTTEPVATPPTTLRRHEFNAKSRFFRLGSGQVFYKDENMVLHRVNGGCKDQGCVSEECASALEISEMIANSQALGEDFNCDLLAPTHGGSSGSGFNWTVRVSVC